MHTQKTYHAKTPTDGSDLVDRNQDVNRDVDRNINDKVHHHTTPRAAVLLVSGKARAGKDAFVQRLRGVTRVAFADAAKDALSTHLGSPRELLNTQQGKASLWNGIPLRQHLIAFAEQRRAQDPSCWARVVAPEAATAAISSPAKVAAVADWRFRCEIDTVRELLPPNITLITVRVENPTLVPDPTFASHISETELDDFSVFDFVIVNDGSLDDLQRKADKLLKEVQNRLEPQSQQPL